MRLSASTSPCKGADHTAVVSPVLGDYTIEPSGVWHYNGTEWIRDSDPQVIQGGGSALYFTSISAGSGYEQLSPAPDFSGIDEEYIALPTANTPVYLNHQYKAAGAIGSANIPAGQWGFRIYAKADNANHETTLRFDVGTIDVLDAVTWHFSVVSPAILTTVLADYSFVSVQPALVNAAADKIVIRVSGVSEANNTGVTWVHSSAVAYSHISTPPLPILHNELEGINTGDFLHLTAAEKAALGNGGTELITLIADSNVATGQKLILKSNGAVEAVVGNSVTEGFITSNAELSNGVANLDIAMAYSPDYLKNLMIYNDGSLTKLNTFTLNGNNTLTFDTAITLYSSVSNDVACCWGGGVWLVVYRGASQFFAVIVTIVSNAITAGAPVALDNVSTQALALSYDEIAAKFVVWSSSSASTNLRAGLVSVESGVITTGSFAQIGTITPTQIASSYNTLRNKHLVILYDAYATGYMKYATATITNGVLTVSAVATVESTAIANEKVTLAIDTDLSTFLMHYLVGGVITYRKATIDNAGAVTFTSAANNSNNGSNCALSYDINKGVFITAAFNSTFNYRAYSFAKTLSNYTDYIGIAQATQSSGSSVSVRINGVDSLQSGLTPNTKYYLQADGSISATVSSVYFGKALAATKVLLNPAV